MARGRPKKIKESTEEAVISIPPEKVADAIIDDPCEDISSFITPEQPGKLRRIKVTQEQVMKLQKEGKLVGYDPSTNEAIIY